MTEKELISASDAVLTAAAQKGDKAAQSVLLDRYESLVKVIARSFSVAGIDKDDVAQTARIALLNAIMTYDPEKGAEFKTYATVCIKNRALDTVKSARRTLDNELSRDGTESEPEDDKDATVFPSPEEIYLQKEAETALYEALRTLLGQRDFDILMLYIAGMSYKEISEKIGITAKKVDNTLYSAKKKVSSLIKTLKG